MTAKKNDAELAAEALGMKEREITDVRQDAEGLLAQTHDGNWTLIRDGGVLEFLGQDLGERVKPAEVEESKPAPKGRSQA